MRILPGVWFAEGWAPVPTGKLRHETAFKLQPPSHEWSLEVRRVVSVEPSHLVSGYLVYRRVQKHPHQGNSKTQCVGTCTCASAIKSAGEADKLGRPNGVGAAKFSSMASRFDRTCPRASSIIVCSQCRCLRACVVALLRCMLLLSLGRQVSAARLADLCLLARRRCSG